MIKGYAIYNNTLVEYLYDTGADTSIMQKVFIRNNIKIRQPNKINRIQR
jgi:hypothetical protein